jgi:hypothetical protein
VLLPEYVLNRPFIDTNDSKAAGMQGSPKSLDDMTEGQAEDRFYQLVYYEFAGIMNSPIGSVVRFIAFTVY